MAAFTLADLAGSWRGIGTVVEAGDAAKQPVRCRLTGQATRTGISMRGKCATSRGKGDVVLKLTAKGRTISGTWQTTAAKGLFRTSGRLNSGGFRADLMPTNPRDSSGSLVVTMKGAKTFVLVGRSKLDKGERSQIVFTRK